MRIAVLEDDAAQAELIQSWFQEAGHDCHRFASGREFKNALQHETFDMIYLVAAVADTQVKARELAGYISTTLKNQSVTYPDGYSVWSVVTEQDPYMDVSNIQNRQYWIAGAVYRFRGIK